MILVGDIEKCEVKWDSINGMSDRGDNTCDVDVDDDDLCESRARNGGMVEVPRVPSLRSFFLLDVIRDPSSENGNYRSNAHNRGVKADD